MLEKEILTRFFEEITVYYVQYCTYIFSVLST